MPKQREILQDLTFKEKGTFQSLYAAKRWLTENGYESGSLDACNPVAIQKGEYVLPQKWHNLGPIIKSAIIDGIMTSNDWREGEVKVIIYK